MEILNNTKWLVPAASAIVAVSIGSAVYSVSPASIKMIVNGEPISEASAPQLVNGTFMIPMTAEMKERLQLETEWNEQENTLYLRDKEAPMPRVVASSTEAKAMLYAIEKADMLAQFKLEADGATRTFPNWKNSSNPTFAPQLIFNDINNDGNKELVIILTTGHGTGLSEEDVHVLQKKDGWFEEVSVDNPLALVLKHVRTTLSPQEAVVTTGDKETVVDIQKLEIAPENLFNNVYFGSIVNYEVADNRLVARVAGQVAPASFIGETVITYEWKNNMYQAQQIQFIGY